MSSPIDQESSFLHGVTLSSIEDDELPENSASVLFYGQAGEPPKELLVRAKNVFVSFIDDDTFARETAFLEVPIEIYDIGNRRFIPIPSTAYLRYPSPCNPFFIMRDGRLDDSDCPELPEHIDKLESDARNAGFKVGSEKQSTSQVTLSPPPPAQPPHRVESPVQVECFEEGTQATSNPNTSKRKQSCSPESDAGAPATNVRKTTIVLNLHFHDRKGKGKKKKNGTGNCAEDPIVV